MSVTFAYKINTAYNADTYGNDKRLLQQRKMKALEYNYKKYGVHNFILANYYKNKVQLLSDLKNFLKHKTKK